MFHDKITIKYLMSLNVQYSLSDDEHKMFETCRRHEELVQNIILKRAFCWLTLHKYGTH